LFSSPYPAPAPPRAGPVDVRSTPEREFSIPSQRIKMTSPTPGATFKAGTNILRPCRLVGITFFIDTPDTGDYVNAFLRGRVIVDALLVDMVNNTSYPVSLAEEVQPGDLLEVAYVTKGATTKNLTWTPKAVLL